MNDVVEFLFRVVFQILFEVIIKGTGWCLLKLFAPSSNWNPEGPATLVTGLIFWGLAIFGLVVLL